VLFFILKNNWKNLKLILECLYNYIYNYINKINNKQEVRKMIMYGYFKKDELLEKLKSRVNTPKEEFIKYEGAEKFWELIMEDKKKNGWKFKDEE
jgi:hypothetical protein